jgi:hypothetical protein
MARRFLALMAVMAVAVPTTACDTRVSGVVGVTPPATRIAFASQPSNAQVGVAITPAVQVVVQNTNGETITSSNVPISLTIAPGTGAVGAVLTGGATQTAVSGVVNFTNLRINLAGTGYQLVATATGFPSITSTAFDITP